MGHGVPSGGVGADTDKSGLPERCQAGDSGHQHEAERRHRVDRDIVHQSDGEAAEDQWGDGDEGDRGSDDDTGSGAHHEWRSPSSSSISSSTPLRVANDCHSRMGMSEPKTMTSLSALFQNEAKLSNSPTRIAPAMVAG